MLVFGRVTPFTTGRGPPHKYVEKPQGLTIRTNSATHLFPCADGSACASGGSEQTIHEFHRWYHPLLLRLLKKLTWSFGAQNSFTFTSFSSFKLTFRPRSNFVASSKVGVKTRVFFSETNWTIFLLPPKKTVLSSLDGLFRCRLNPTLTFSSLGIAGLS